MAKQREPTVKEAEEFTENIVKESKRPTNPLEAKAQFAERERGTERYRIIHGVDRFLGKQIRAHPLGGTYGHAPTLSRKSNYNDPREAIRKQRKRLFG